MCFVNEGVRVGVMVKHSNIMHYLSAGMYQEYLEYSRSRLNPLYRILTGIYDGLPHAELMRSRRCPWDERYIFSTEARPATGKWLPPSHQDRSV